MSLSSSSHEIVIDYVNKTAYTLLAFLKFISYTNSQNHHSPSYKLHPTNIHDAHDPVVPLRQGMYTRGDIFQNSSCPAHL